MFEQKRSSSDFNSEIEAHLKDETDRLIDQGLTQQEARRTALLTFGNVTRARERFYESGRTLWVEHLWQDIRFGLRMLVKNPGFSAIAVLTLALGIGANTAIFSVVQGVMLAPLPYPDPDRLVLIWQNNPHAPRVSVSLPDFRDWQRYAHGFDQLSGLRWYQFNLTNPGAPEHISGYEISAGFFQMLGVHPMLGREFSVQEDQPGGTPVALISYKEWQERFGGSPNTLGKSVTLNGVSYTIIGITPAGFQLASPVDVYIPLGQGDPRFNDRRYPGVLGVARLKKDKSIRDAQNELTAVQQSLDTLYPDADRGLGVDVLPLKQAIVGDTSATLLLMLGAVALVLLIACANVANLLLARSSARSREFTIRSALGAGRIRVIQQVLTESVLLALAGGALGLAVAKLGSHLVLAMLSGTLNRTAEVGLNGPVLLFVLCLSVAVGILFGLAPALKTLSSDLQSSLKRGARGSTGSSHRTQNALIVGQMALTLMLLVGAALLFRTIHDLWRADPGFTADNLLTFKVGLSPSVSRTPATARAAHHELMDRICAIPGVQSADSTNLVPLSQLNNFAPFWIGRRETTPLAEASRLLLYWTGPDYIKAFEIPLLRGRYFTDQDNAGSERVIVIDSVLAQTYFAGKDPIGESITINLWGDARVVGVVGHIRHSGLGDPVAFTQPQAYAPLNQLPDASVPSVYSGLTIVLRTTLDPASI